MSERSEWGPPTLGEVLSARLFEQRRVVVSGVLDDRVASDTATALMALDASGDGPITLRLDCAATALEPAFVLIDTIDLLGVTVEATCVGRLEGPAVGVLAVAHHRTMTPHARIHLCEPATHFSGSATDVERWAAHHEERLLRFVARLAEATGQPVEHVEADLRCRRYLSAEDALAYGLIDEIQRPGANLTAPEPRRPFGFGPTSPSN
jgi:ATP-dependent Clp protease, protease subunit